MTAPDSRPAALDALAARVVILVGHFGSGKSEIAINVALGWRERGLEVSLVDLDVVKPYFRVRATRDFMAERGIAVIAPEGENVHADLPIIVPAVRRLLLDPEARLVVDVGGDPVGTRALGSLSDLVRRAETAHLVVLNFRRPYTETVDDAVVMCRAIEEAARLPLTGIVSNTHLLGETTAADVTYGFEMSREVAARLGLGVKMVVVDEATRGALHEGEFGCAILTLRRLIRPPFEPMRVRTSGPLFALN